MKKPVKARAGRPCAYTEDELNAVMKRLREGAPRPNRSKIASDLGVGLSFVNYRWQLIRHEYEPKEVAEAGGEK